jgi:hypothetical protein
MYTAAPRLSEYWPGLWRFPLSHVLAWAQGPIASESVALLAPSGEKNISPHPGDTTSEVVSTFSFNLRF